MELYSIVRAGGGRADGHLATSAKTKLVYMLPSGRRFTILIDDDIDDDFLGLPVESGRSLAQGSRNQV